MTSRPTCSGGRFVRNGSIFVVAADGRTAKVYLRAKSEKGTRTTYYLPAWSPEGKRLAVDEGWEPPPNSEMHGWSYLVVFRQRGTSPPAARRESGSIPARSSWSPDGRRLVYCSVYGFGDAPDEYSCSLRIVAGKRDG